jgi:hypothetical protein
MSDAAGALIAIQSIDFTGEMGPLADQSSKLVEIGPA